jgi:hypothetical protein
MLGVAESVSISIPVASAAVSELRCRSSRVWNSHV